MTQLAHGKDTVPKKYQGFFLHWQNTPKTPINKGIS